MAERDPAYPGDFIAQLFNLTPRRVQQLATDGVIPRAGRGKYPLIASVQGYTAFLQERVTGDRQGGFRVERERLAKEQADKVAIENARVRGEVIYAQHVEDAIAAAVANLAGDLDGLPGRLASALAGVDDPALIRSMLLDETRRIRESYSKGLAESADPDGNIAAGSADNPAAPET